MCSAKLNVVSNIIPKFLAESTAESGRLYNSLNFYRRTDVLLWKTTESDRLDIKSIEFEVHQ